MNELVGREQKRVVITYRENETESNTINNRVYLYRTKEGDVLNKPITNYRDKRDGG